MAAFNPEERMKNIISIIESEANEKAETIEHEAKDKSTHLQNKAYASLKQQLNAEFTKKRENEEVRVKTYI